MSREPLRIFTHSHSTAVRCAHLAHLAYRDNTKIRSTLDWLGYTNIENITRGAATGFVGCSPCGVAVGSIAGSNEAADWLHNGRVIPVRGPYYQGDRCHAGVQAYLDLLWVDFRQALEQASAGWRRPVILVGHSMGGAAATQAAARLAANNEQARTGLVQYTFGEMRSGTRRFAMLHRAAVPRHYRYTFHNDPVPWVPWLCGTYHHAGTHLHFSSNCDLWRDPPLRTLLVDAFGGISRGMLSWFLRGAIVSHSMLAYTARVDAYAAIHGHD